VDGYFYIVGRLKEMIKVGGFQVWPGEIERVISQHPSVKEVAIAGVPDLAKGEAVKAWIVLNKDKTITIQDLQDFCKDKLVEYKLPTQLQFVHALPRSTIGKILRRELIHL
jgi:long-chain acyl-CoA synthetase